MSGRNPTPWHDPDPDISAYALGVLEPEEQERIETHLAECATCRAELDRYETVVGELGAAIPPVAPRPGLRQEILSEIHTGGSTLPLRRHRQVPAVWLGIAAAIAILSLFVFGTMYVQIRGERDDARSAQHAIADYLKDGGTLAALKPAPGAPDTAQGHGSLIVAPDQSGAMLVVYDLPPTTDHRMYRAWAERAGERVDLGELRVDNEGTGWLYLYAADPMSSYETVGVSQVSPGNPEGEPLLTAPMG